MGLKVPLARAAGPILVLSTTAIHGQSRAKELMFHNVTFLLLSFGFTGDQRLVCRVTSPRRFPRANHATRFEIFFGGFMAA